MLDGYFFQFEVMLAHKAASFGERMSQPAAPGNNSSDVFTHGFRCAYTRTIELRTDGSFAGAACFRLFRPD